MKTYWIFLAFVAIWVAVVTLVSARVCILGTEPDGIAGHKLRFVLPPGDPCSCTEVVLGGHNAYAPPRKDQPIYIDTLPTDAEELHRLLGCMDINAPADDEVSTEISQVEGVSSVTTPTTSDVTSTVTPTTSDVTSTVTPTTSDVTSTVIPSTTEIPPYMDCQEALDAGHNISGVYTIQHGQQIMKAYCNMDPAGKGYIVIQRRINGSVNFTRSWEEYKHGFGDLEGEFWWGNEKLRNLTETDTSTWELVVDLKAFDGKVGRAISDGFKIESDVFKIMRGTYKVPNEAGIGDAGEAFHEKPFTTYDRDNDDRKNENCAELLGGGWWFKQCDDTRANLNGVYSNVEAVEGNHGIRWETWDDYKLVSLKECEMKMRRNPSN